MHIVLDERAVRTALNEPGIWPNLTQAAGITGLSKGTLSKQAHTGKVTSMVRGFGQGERVFPPQEVLRIGSTYRRVSSALLVERLANFLSEKLSTHPRLVQRVLWTLIDTAGYSSVQSRPASPASPAPDPDLEPPNWLLEVERLREDPHALAGTLSFTSVDDLIGTVELGPSIDDPINDDLLARDTAW